MRPDLCFSSYLASPLDVLRGLLTKAASYRNFPAAGQSHRLTSHQQDVASYCGESMTHAERNG